MNHSDHVILFRDEERIATRCGVSGKIRDDDHEAKEHGLRWGISARRGRCDPCPMRRHRAAGRAYPNKPICPIRVIHINPEVL